MPFLHHIGVQRLDALVITHPHLDHFGGASSLLRMFPVNEIWTNECSRIVDGVEADWQEVIGEARNANIPVREIRRGFIWRENFFEVRAIHPRNESAAT